jgi:alpha-tubulin suppressor-like RCC1 family protein
MKMNTRTSGIAAWIAALSVGLMLGSGCSNDVESSRTADAGNEQRDVGEDVNQPADAATDAEPRQDAERDADAGQASDASRDALSDAADGADAGRTDASNADANSQADAAPDATPGCGAGPACGANEVCSSAGVCESCAAPTSTACDNACVDIETDPNHCGGCGIVCEGLCTAGACALPVAVSAGESHACVVFDDGTVRCWGNNADGQFGNSSSGTTNAVPQPVMTGPDSADLLGNAVSVSAGASHTCALLDDASAVCWGSNAHGKIGDNIVRTHALTASPIFLDQVISSPGTGNLVLAVSAGRDHTCATFDNHEVYCWGSNALDQAGLDSGVLNLVHPKSAASTETRNLAAAPNGMVDLSGASSHICAIDGGGQIWCWGQNDHGQSGTGVSSNSLPRPAEVDFGAVSPAYLATNIETGKAHSCALLASGEVYCWGENDHYQTGHGNNDFDRYAPSAPAAYGAAADLSAGSEHTCVIDRIDGRIHCWGNNDKGQLGRGMTTVATQSPAPVQNLGAAVAIDAGDNFTCAVIDDGAVYCWGVNDMGQLGNASVGAAYSTTPVRVRWR